MDEGGLCCNGWGGSVVLGRRGGGGEVWYGVDEEKTVSR